MKEIVEAREDTFWYIAYSKYYYQIEQYLRYFDQEQILILTLDKLSSEPEAVMSNIFNFLEVDSDYCSEGFKKRFHDSSHKVKPSKLLSLFRKTPFSIAYQEIKPMLPQSMHMQMKRKLGKHFEKPKLNSNQMLFLENIFRDDVKKLRDFTGDSFREWKCSYQAVVVQ